MTEDEERALRSLRDRLIAAGKRMRDEVSRLRGSNNRDQRDLPRRRMKQATTMNAFEKPQRGAQNWAQSMVGIGMRRGREPLKAPDPSLQPSGVSP
jgi:hypothetical protein